MSRRSCSRIWLAAVPDGQNISDLYNLLTDLERIPHGSPERDQAQERLKSAMLSFGSDEERKQGVYPEISIPTMIVEERGFAVITLAQIDDAGELRISQEIVEY